MADPTPGLMRAARAVQLQSPATIADTQHLAELIGREAAVPQLVEALRGAESELAWVGIKPVSEYAAASPSSTYNRYRAICAALAAHEKGGEG